MEVTLFGQFVPNFNFATVCFQPDILLSEANAVDYVKEISNNEDEGNNTSNDIFENETKTQDGFVDHLSSEVEEKGCETAETDISLGNNVSENSVKPKLRRTRHSPEEYKCDSCPYTCTTEKAFLKHCTSEKCGAGESRLSCPICGKDRPSREEMNVHMKKHKLNKFYHCDICRSYKTVQLMKLIQHRRMHTGEKPHLCPFCCYRSSRRDNLRSHVKRVHKESSLPGDTFAPRTLIITPSQSKQ